MILECPNCETCYEIPEDLPPEGRKVRCASCQHVWNATIENQPKAPPSIDDFDDEEIVFKNDDEMAMEATEEPAAEPEADAGNDQGSIDDIFGTDTPAEEPAEEPVAEEGNSQSSVDDLFAQEAETEEPPEEPAPEEKAVVDTDAFAESETAPEEETAESGPPTASDESFSESAMEEVFTSAVKESDSSTTTFSGEETEEAETPPIIIGKAKKRRSFVPGNIAAGWAALAIILSSVTSFAYFNSITVVRMLPGSAATYESFGLPVNVRGLEFDKIKYSWETSAGRPVLEVFGDIVNVTSEPLKVPTVVFGLRTKEKVEVYQWAADVRTELLPGGQRTAFSAQIPTPPKSIRDLQVRFAKVR